MNDMILITGGAGFIGYNLAVRGHSFNGVYVF